MKQTPCTAFEAAVAWEQHRGGLQGNTGLVLVVDLDRGDAGICQWERNALPRQQWCCQGGIQADFFQTLVQRRFPDCADPAALASLLYEAAADPAWTRAQKAYLRSGRTMALSLPSVAAQGTAVSLTCAELDEIYHSEWADVTRKSLEAAKTHLAGQTARIVPVGRLARLFLAEYLIRETFLAMPLLDDPILRLWTPEEDPSQVIRQGMEHYRSSQPQLLAQSIFVQVQRRQGDSLKPELLTLAKQGTGYKQLARASYTGPVYLGTEDTLTLFADSQPHCVSLPAGLGPVVELGLAVYDRKLTLCLRKGNRVTRIPLDWAEETGGKALWKATTK